MAFQRGRARSSRAVKAHGAINRRLYGRRPRDCRGRLSACRRQRRRGRLSARHGTRKAAPTHAELERFHSAPSGLRDICAPLRARPKPFFGKILSFACRQSCNRIYGYPRMFINNNADTSRRQRRHKSVCVSCKIKRRVGQCATRKKRAPRGGTRALKKSILPTKEERIL
jgi:hypothetical protein